MYILTILIGYSIIPLLIDTPSLKINWVSEKNNLVNTPKKQLICFSVKPNVSVIEQVECSCLFKCYCSPTHKPISVLLFQEMKFSF